MHSIYSLGLMPHRAWHADARGMRILPIVLSAKWAMPVTLREVPKDLQASTCLSGAAGHALLRRVSGTGLRCVVPRGETLEDVAADGFLMQPAGRELRFAGDGAVCMAEFALEDSHLRSVAIDCFGCEADRPDLLHGGRPVRRDAQLVSMLDDYLRLALREDEQPSRIEMDSRANLITLRLLRAHSAMCQNATSHSRGGLAPWRLRRACETMTRDLTASISMHALADMLDVSYHHFCHAFKESVGMAPYQWLVERRVERACELLRATRSSIGDIAAAVGYEDPNQLARVFKTRRGITPVAYRRECGSWAGQA